MQGNNAPRYKVAHLSKAEKQVRPAFTNSLKELVAILESTPATFGEGQYHTHLSGGIVRHGVMHGLSTEFVVYENQRAVVVLSIVPVGNHPLAGQGR